MTLPTPLGPSAIPAKVGAGFVSGIASKQTV